MTEKNKNGQKSKKDSFWSLKCFLKTRQNSKALLSMVYMGDCPATAILKAVKNCIEIALQSYLSKYSFSINIFFTHVGPNSQNFLFRNLRIGLIS
jgi:hypothetical protein